MKRTLLFLLPTFAFLLSSCVSVRPGSDPVVVNAERTTAAAFHSFDAFLALEHRNSAFIRESAPEVHKFAENLRKNGPLWLGSARSATKAYKINRTPENEADLNTAIAILNVALYQVQVYSASINVP